MRSSLFAARARYWRLPGVAVVVVALGLAMLVTACSSVPSESPQSAPAATGPALKIGIALGGGSVKGFAHIGVIKMLEANGLAPLLWQAPVQVAWSVRCTQAA